MRGKQHNNTQWISISDMMTGLMVIFMFIAVNYIMQVIEHKFVENEIFNRLSIEFDEEIENGDMRISSDGLVTFTPKDSTNLFDLGNMKVDSNFAKSLDKFIPKYLDVILQDDYLEYIKEIRIEGHSDTVPCGKKLHRDGNDNYEDNLWVSSERAQSVLKYIRNMEYYTDLDPDSRTRLDFLFTANGRSFSHSLNSKGEYSYLDPDKAIDNELSRRVEFRLITSNEKVIQEFAKREP